MNHENKPLKVYVAVRADFREDGIMIPREITWEDGTRFEIDRILDIRQDCLYILNRNASTQPF